MKQKFTILISFLFLTFLSINAQNELQILDPQISWSNDQGTIEEATLQVKPCGIYMENNLNLTFSARGTYFGDQDILEVYLQFTLPEGTIVNDLRLWIGNEIVKAKIMDQWTASSIYEQIVNRRRDPAILVKRSKQNYELRIYPMKGNETRKIMINYLVPMEWLSNLVSSYLPINILNTSRNKLEKLQIEYYPNTEWQVPTISSLSNVNFTSHQDSLSQTYYEAEIFGDDFSTSLNMNFNTPLKNGFYLNKFSNGNEGIYQLAFLPSSQIQDTSKKKVSILLDYEPNMSSISVQDLFAQVKSLLKYQFAKVDSFNIFYSKLEVEQVSPKWLCADSINIENSLNSVFNNSISFYSNLPSLLKKGIDFVKTNGNDGQILLIANSNQVASIDKANKLLNDLQTILDPVFPIHIVDFNDLGNEWNWIGGRDYINNEYFYLNLARITHSKYLSIRNNNSIAEMLSSIVQSLSGMINSFDLHTTLDNGFCYGRFNTNLNESVYMNSAILQVGKFIGNFPLKVEFSGVFNSKVFSNSFSINDEDIHEGDSLNNIVWTGNYISSLETGYENNEEINNIIGISLDNRILSLYTAFIALEPGMSSEFCYDCIDNNEWLVDVENKNDALIADSLFIQAYPNPFNPTTTLNVNLPKDANVDELNMKIYNILGEEVMSFDPLEFATGRNFKLTWNGVNNYGEPVSTGIYFFVVSTKSMRQTAKLVMMK